MLTIELPYPPSINHYWRRFGAKTLISRSGRAFRQEVEGILASRRIRPMSGALEVVVKVFPPDRRRRDIDNCLKSLLDALEHGGAYHDDSQIERLSIHKGEVQKGGRTLVTIQQLKEHK